MIIAHRGESYLAPENSLASINMAWHKGAEAVEIDIQLTTDNEIVVIHDSNTKRVGNKNLKIAASTLE
jgi:glycerophosphoryl diester phosphodiesterase